MKCILQINVTANIGSTGRIVENLGDLAISHGSTSYIACRDFNDSKSNIIEIGNKKDFYFHSLQTRLLDNHGFGSISATKQLIKTIKKINPDVIHLHNLHGYYLNVSILFDYLRKSNKSIFWTLYDCWSFTGHCSYYDLVKCNKWQTECNNCPNKNEYPKSILLDRSRQNFIRKKEIFTGVKNLNIIVNSKWLKGEVEKSFLSDYQISVIYNGINLNDFKPANTFDRLRELKLEKKFIIIGIASEWGKRKGLNDFIKLSYQLQEDEIIVLDGLNKSQKNKLPENIIALDRAKSIKELTVLYSMADVFVNTTKEDNFPTTNLEALACGTPVITYDSGGSPEAVDEKTGFIVEKENIKSLIFTIRKVKKRGSKLYFDECIKKATTEFNYKKNYKKIINLY